MNRVFLTVWLLASSLGCLGLPVEAADRQGKKSLETPTQRPRENKPSQSGTARVVDQTRAKKDRVMDGRSTKPSGAEVQQGKTREKVEKSMQIKPRK